MQALLERLECLSYVDKNRESLQKGVHVLQQIIHTPFWNSKGAEMVGLLLHKLPPRVVKGYANYCVTHKPYPLSQTMTTLYMYLDEKETVENMARAATYRQPPTKQGNGTHGNGGHIKRTYVTKGTEGEAEAEGLEYEDSLEVVFDDGEDFLLNDVPPAPATVLVTKTVQKPACAYCKGNHNIVRCNKFINETLSKDRISWILRNSHCSVCLQKHAGDCYGDFQRYCKHCKKKEHHSYLHPASQAVDKKKKAGSVTFKTSPKAKKLGRVHLATGVKMDSLEEEESSDLHEDEKGGEEETEQPETKTAQNFVAKKQAEDDVSLCTGVIRVAHPKTGHQVLLNALNDTCATDTVMSLTLAEKLGLKGPLVPYRVMGHGGHEATFQAMKTELRLLDQNGKQVTTAPVYCYNDPLEGLVVEDWAELKRDWPHLKDLDIPPVVKEGQAQIIIGTKWAGLGASVTPDIVGPQLSDPVARKTILGYFICGQTDPDVDPSENVRGANMVMKTAKCYMTKGVGTKAASAGGPKPYASEAQHLDSNGQQISKRTATLLTQLNSLQWDTSRVKKKHKEQAKENERTNEIKSQLQSLSKHLPMIWNPESSEETQWLKNAYHIPPLKIAEKRAVKAFNESYQKDKNGAVTVDLLWSGRARPKENALPALLNFERAEARMKAGDGELWKNFKATTDDWEELQVAVEIPEDEAQDGYYIPTFMVVRLDKTTTQYRLIVNAAYEFNGECINDLLDSGPNLMNTLLSVLTRFRTHRYVFTGDVSKMFLMVKVTERSQKYLRIYTRRENGKVACLQATRHIFGLTCSPYNVMQTVRLEAEKQSKLRPLGARAIKQDIMVDDVLTGHSKRKGVIQMYKEVKEIMNGVGMKIHKFATNCGELRALIPEEEHAKQIILEPQEADLLHTDGSDVPSLKCLGMLYNPSTDTLQFLPPSMPKLQVWTKRAVSSLTAKAAFDPLGLLTPVLLRPRLLMQELWRYGQDDLGWDDPVSIHLVTQLTSWFNTYQRIAEVRIPRCVNVFNSKDIDLVVFTDSSDEAQAAAAYLVSGKDQPKRQARLLPRLLGPGPGCFCGLGGLLGRFELLLDLGHVGLVVVGGGDPQLLGRGPKFGLKVGQPFQKLCNEFFFRKIRQKTNRFFCQISPPNLIFQTCFKTAHLWHFVCASSLAGP